VYPFPPQQYGHAGCTTFHCQQYERAGCILSTASSVDVHGVSLSTASRMDTQGVSLSAASSIDMQDVSLTTTSSVDVQGGFFSPPAVWTCRVYGVLLLTTNNVNVQGISQTITCRGSSPVLECFCTGMKYRMPECRCPAMQLDNDIIILSGRSKGLRKHECVCDCAVRGFLFLARTPPKAWLPSLL
jgi:hypothetical protein